jgi:predicted ATP-dependent serine protease
VPPACFGEVGLTGELRPVAHADRRLEEAAKFGLEPVICPAEAGAGEMSGGAPAATLAAALRNGLQQTVEIAA